MNIKTNPSDLKNEYPFDSVFQKSEYETVAKNIIVILAINGDTWRELTYEEYECQRIKDGRYSKGERHFFEQVVRYTTSPENAGKFSREWGKVVEKTK